MRGFDTKQKATRIVLAGTFCTTHMQTTQGAAHRATSSSSSLVGGGVQLTEKSSHSHIHVLHTKTKQRRNIYTSAAAHNMKNAGKVGKFNNPPQHRAQAVNGEAVWGWWWCSRVQCSAVSKSASISVEEGENGGEVGRNITIWMQIDKRVFMHRSAHTFCSPFRDYEHFK